jgi:hypothetical protein
MPSKTAKGFASAESLVATLSSPNGRYWKYLLYRSSLPESLAEVIRISFCIPETVVKLGRQVIGEE